MKFVKKLTALFLAIIMTMALGVTAFAADSKVTLSIKDPVAGHTYKVYQILTGDVTTEGEGALNNGTGSLTNMDKGYSLNSYYAAGSIDDVLAVLKTSTGSFKTDADLGNAAYDLIKADSPNKGVTAGAAVAEFKQDSDGKWTSSASVDTGYYIIVDESYDGTDKTNVVYSRNMVAVVGDTAVTPKTSKKDIDKNIVNNTKADGSADPDKAIDYVDGKGGKTDTAAIGDVIKYEITGKVPNTDGYTFYYYVINDTFSDGLTFNNDITVSIKSADGTKSATLVKDTDYVVLTGDDAGDYTFQVAFKDMKSLYATYGEDAVITVAYTGTVNEKAVIGINPNTNTANLTYSNKPNDSEQYDKDKYVPDESHPQGETPDRITKTYVTELNLIKVDQDGMPLKGAEFTLTGKNLNKVIINTDYTFEDAGVDENGNFIGTFYALNTDPVTYTQTKPTGEVKDAQGNVITKSNCDDYVDVTDAGKGDGSVTVTKMYKRTVVTKTTTDEASNSSVKAYVNDNGYVTFTGLNIGEYTLSETHTPDGYTTISDITFTIGATQTGSTELIGGQVAWNVSKVTTGQTVSYNAKTGTFEITIKNLPGSVLPTTGGMGTTVIYIAGIAMIVAAGVVVIARKRFA